MNAVMSKLLLFEILLLVISHCPGVHLSYPSCPPCHCYVDHGVNTADCAGRNLSSIPSNIPTETQSLLLGKNKLIRLEKNQFVAVPNLRTLDLSENHISAVDVNALKGLQKLQFLSMERNSLHTLNNDTFRTLHSVKYLNLSNCKLKTIDLDAFTQLKDLIVLDISENPRLGLKGLANATYGLQDSTIEKLYMNKLVSDVAVCVFISNTIAKRLQSTNLTEIHADRNRIELFGDRALELLPKTLKKLYLRQNRLTLGPYLEKMSALEELEELDCSGKHGAHDLPIFGNGRPTVNEMSECQDTGDCGDNMAVYNGPNDFLDVLPLFDTIEIPPITYHIPPKLKKLKCAYNQMSYHITEVIFSNNSMTHMDLSSNLLTTWLGPVHGLEHLKYLDLSNNIARNVSLVFFQNFTDLELLNVSYNFLGGILSQDREGKLFKRLKKLRILDLSNNFISGLFDDALQGLTSLRVMNLSKNNIHDLFVNIGNLKHLHTIRCTSNQIQWIPKYLIRDLDKLAENHAVTFDLSGNPIACRCENLHFLLWLMTSKVKFGNFSDYFCLFNDGHNQTFDNLDEIYDNLYASCYSHFGIALGAVAAFVLTMCVILWAVLYRYRWKLRYWYYAARLRYSRPSESCAQGEYEFDAFVSFADEDRDFVTDDLMTKLEDGAGLRLNFHQRDFTPGRPIAQNIVNAVQISKRTLVILSEDFLESGWCKYELEMANMEKVTTERDVILIVMYRSVKSRDIPAEITYHIKNDSFIEYPHQGDTGVFWRSLIEALRA